MGHMPNRAKKLTERVIKFIESKLAKDPRSSPAGIHFIQQYNQNKRIFYLKYVKGWVPMYTAPALIRGGAIADAQEYYYTHDFDAEGCIQVFEEILAGRASQYEDENQFEKDLDSWAKALLHWIDCFQEHDRKNFEILEVEQTHYPKLANGFRLTIRTDGVFRDREDGRILIREGKHTGYSIGKMYDSVRLQDQATAYQWAIAREYPDESILGVFPDIIYMRKSKIDAKRPGIISRSKRELREFELETIGLLMEMAQKVRSLDLYPPELLFPRNGKDDAYFGTEYEPLIRGARSNLNRRLPPAGFIEDPMIAKEQPLMRFIEDFETEEKQNGV